MRYKIITIIFSFLCATYGTAINNTDSKFNIQASAPFAKGSTVYLARYWKSNPYSIDSTTVSPEGKFSFSKAEPLEPGQYLLLIKPDQKIELLIDKQQSDIKIDLNENLINSTISGNDDTKLYWNYIKEYTPYASQIQKLYNILENEKSSDQERAEAKKQYAQLLDKIDQLLNKHIKAQKGTWFASFIKAAYEINPPHLFPEEQQQQIENGQYLRKHFFDNIDFEDKRLWNTEFFSRQMDYFLYNIVSQHPDSIAQATSELVAKSQNNNEAFEQMFSNLFNSAATSPMMGMENVWARLAEDYIFDKDISWIDSTLHSSLLAEYALIEQNRLGMIAQDLLLRTIDGDSIHTSEVEADFTLLYFYSTTCSHCDHEMEELRKNFFPKYTDRGLKVITVNTGTDIEAWKKFMTKHEMEGEGWYNLFDPSFSSQYWLKFDVSATPSLYFLDKDKRILAKKIDLTNLELYLSRILK